MIKVKAAPVMGELKSFYDRVSRLEDDREALSADTKELTKEIKGAGYNAKAIKRLVKESRKKTDEQLEADLELYRSVLSMPGATLRSAAKYLGVPKSTLHRLVPRKSNGTSATPAHDSDGVIAEEDDRQEGVASSLAVIGAVCAVNAAIAAAGEKLAPHVSLLAEPDQNSASASISTKEKGPEDHSTEHQRVEGENDENLGMGRQVVASASGADVVATGQGVGDDLRQRIAPDDSRLPTEGLCAVDGARRAASNPAPESERAPDHRIEAPLTETADVVASTCERVATSNSVSAKIAHTDDDLAIPTFLRRPLPQVSA